MGPGDGCVVFDFFLEEECRSAISWLLRSSHFS